jgi:hypothetical protein
MEATNSPQGAIAVIAFLGNRMTDMNNPVSLDQQHEKLVAFVNQMHDELIAYRAMTIGARLESPTSSSTRCRDSSHMPSICGMARSSRIKQKCFLFSSALLATLAPKAVPRNATFPVSNQNVC